MARDLPQDWREFVRIAVDLPENPKLAALNDPAAGWLYVTSLCYCGRNHTDGAFPIAVVTRIAGVTKTRAEKLMKAGLWHKRGHSCDRCPQPIDGHAVVHDYLRHNRSAEQVERLREARSQAGARGAEARWGNGTSGSNSMASAMASATPTASQPHGNGDGKCHGKTMADGWQQHGNPMAEVEEEKEIKEPPNGGSFGTPQAKPKQGTRIPEDFAVTRDMVEWARDNTPVVDGPYETQQFIDYWRARPGKDALKLDWRLTWQRWMRKAQRDTEERQKRLRPATRNGFASQTDANIAAFLGATGTEGATVLPLPLTRGAQ